MSPPLPPLNHIPQDIVSASDYARRAPQHMTAAAWAYLSGGASDEITLAENTAAFARIKLLPRVLQPIAGGHTRLELAGQSLAHPFLLAPVGWQRVFHADGEIAVAQAASILDTPFILSTFATTRIEDAAAAATAPLWFQIYLQPDRSHTEDLVRRAEAAGCRALVVTVDAPVSGARNREQRAGWQVPAHVSAVNLPSPASAPANFAQAMASAPGWQDIEWLAGITPLPVFVKGVLHPDDAAQSLASGAAGVIVSNHGGRVLDTVPAVIDALPAIAERLNGAAPILMDGGIRRGTDAFKAIALGASAVLIGRPYIHALSVAGALGVAHLIRTLREELEITMALMGCATLAEIGPQHLVAG